MRRSTIGDRAFTVAAPRAWNSLPDSLQQFTGTIQETFENKFIYNLVCAKGQFATVKRLEAAYVAYRAI